MENFDDQEHVKNYPIQPEAVDENGVNIQGVVNSSLEMVCGSCGKDVVDDVRDILDETSFTKIQENSALIAETNENDDKL